MEIFLLLYIGFFYFCKNNKGKECSAFLETIYKIFQISMGSQRFPITSRGLRKRVSQPQKGENFRGGTFRHGKTIDFRQLVHKPPLTGNMIFNMLLVINISVSNIGLLYQRCLNWYLNPK
jgi:hypothetical protein